MGAQRNAAPVIIKRKKVVGGGGHHGGAWKVAYADFVTAMMAFFMLMWLLNATTEKQRKGLADYFSPSIPISPVSGGGDGALGGENVFADTELVLDGRGASRRHPTEARRSRGATGADREGQDRELGAGLKALEQAFQGHSGESEVADQALQHIVTRVTDEGLVVELFATDDAALFERGTDLPTQLLRDIVAMVVGFAGIAVNRVAIEGHVRARPVVLADKPVWSLSMARATKVRVLLERNGFAPERVARVTGHADREPAEENLMAVRNNRIELVFLHSEDEE